MARSSQCLTMALALLSAWFAVCANAGPEDPAATARTVEARSRSWASAAVAGDVDAFRAFATDDYVLLYVEPKSAEHPAHWVTRTRDQWVEELRTGRLKYRSVELMHTKVRLNGDIAVLTGEYTESGVRDGAEFTDGGFFVETWTRRNRQWLAVSSVFP